MANADALRSETGEFSVCNRREDIDRAEEAILAAVSRAHYPEASSFAIRLALEEAIVNAFHHGHRGLAADVPIDVSFAVGPAEVVIEVSDQGPGFHPEEVPDPTLEQNLERTSGRGIMLMRAFMASVDYLGSGNRVRMVYLRPAPEETDR